MGKTLTADLCMFAVLLTSPSRFLQICHFADSEKQLRNIKKRRIIYAAGIIFKPTKIFVACAMAAVIQ